jgi:hypothetical protein
MSPGAACGGGLRPLFQCGIGLGCGMRCRPVEPTASSTASKREGQSKLRRDDARLIRRNFAIVKFPRIRRRTEFSTATRAEICGVQIEFEDDVAPFEF